MENTAPVQGFESVWVGMKINSSPCLTVPCSMRPHTVVHAADGDAESLVHRALGHDGVGVQSIVQGGEGHGVLVHGVALRTTTKWLGKSRNARQKAGGSNRATTQHNLHFRSHLDHSAFPPGHVLAVLEQVVTQETRDGQDGHTRINEGLGPADLSSKQDMPCSASEKVDDRTCWSMSLTSSATSLKRSSL